MPSLESEQISISTVTIKQQNKHLSKPFSVITMVSEVSYSHYSPFHGSADINAVDRHGPAEVTHERILAWRSRDTSALLLFLAVQHKHQRTVQLYNV